jgi:hypothetical protein
MAKLRWGRALTVPLIFIVLFAFLLTPLPVKAGGLAMSGSFYRQKFELPQGVNINSPGIYVVIFNNGGDALKINMTTEAPMGVKLALSEEDFVLTAGEQKKVMVGVNVTEDAVPGEYALKISAEAQREGAGIKIVGSVAQTATLTIIGEVASVEVTAVNPSGEPMPAVVRLYKLVDSEKADFGYSETGSLKIKVSPGKYLAEAYVGGKKLAEETFDIAADEEKTIILTVKTVCFEGFGIVPNYYTETGKFAFAQITYTINNLYQTYPEAEVVLKVTLDGTPLEETTVATLTPLEKVRVGLKYNYIPAGGWVDGTYGFMLQLNLEGEPCATTLEEQLDVSGGGVAGAASHSRYYIIGGVAAAIVASGVYLLIRRRRKIKASSA